MPETVITLHCKSAICVHVSGETPGGVVYEKDADRPLSPASITKLLTAITALKIAAEKGIPASTLMAVAAEDGAEGAGQNLREGDIVSLQHGLANLLLASSNVTANLIARTFGSLLASDEEGRSVDPVMRFVAEMNAVAASLHMAGSHFLNPHGLGVVGQRSTARDLARLVRACLGYPLIGEFWGLPLYAFAVGGPAARTVMARSIFRGSSSAAIPGFAIPQFRGGKSGTLWPSVFNLAAVSETTSGGLIVSVTLASASVEDRHADYLALLKIGNDRGDVSA